MSTRLLELSYGDRVLTKRLSEVISGANYIGLGSPSIVPLLEDISAFVEERKRKTGHHLDTYGTKDPYPMARHGVALDLPPSTTYLMKYRVPDCENSKIFHT